MEASKPCTQSANKFAFAGECQGDAKSGSACEGYEPVLNSRGEDVVIGTAVFEGYLAGETTSGACFLIALTAHAAAALLGTLRMLA